MSQRKSVLDTPFGPIPKTEKPLQRKARLLQGYYRQEVLNEQIGTGPNQNSTQTYCNMLASGEHTGANFLKPEIFEYAQFRYSDKSSVETIERFRLLNNMLSSQPMCFNLFVPLRRAVRSGERFVDSVFQSILPELNIGKIVEVKIEYVPLPIEEYINDKTGFDAFVEYRTREGRKGCIGIETKYVDSLGTNNPKDIRKKLSIGKQIGCFTSEGLERITKKCPQIVRNFMLTEKYRMNHSFHSSQSIILALSEDVEPESEIQKLKKLLRPEFQSKIGKISLEAFAVTIRKNCPSGYEEWITKFQNRYLDRKKAMELLEAVARNE